MIFFDQVNITEDPWEKIYAAEDEIDSGRRRLAARPLHDRLWQRHQRWQ